VFDAEIIEIGSDWSSRNSFWLAEGQALIKPRGRRQRRTEPLVLCGHGVSLRIDSGALVIREGRTHYPQEPTTWRFFKGDLALPPRIVLIDGSGALSFNVMDWLSEQGVALIRLDWKGCVTSVIGAYGYAADRAKVAWQEDTRADPVKRLAFSSALIHAKLKGSIETLRTACAPTPTISAAVARLENEIAILSHGVADIAALRGLEGRAAATYFSAWRGTPILWLKNVRKPIPETWRAIGPRTSATIGKLAKNERATHPLNALLNYAYRMLEGRLQIEALTQGYDPHIGVMHQGYRGSPAYIFDVMEPERPEVDRAILRFIRDHPLAPADFIIRSDGVVRLAPS
jgi:CRISPR-associated protein Cas1